MISSVGGPNDAEQMFYFSNKSVFKRVLMFLDYIATSKAIDTLGVRCFKLNLWARRMSKLAVRSSGLNLFAKMTKLTDLLGCIALFVSVWLGVLLEYTPLKIDEGNKLLVWSVSVGLFSRLSLAEPKNHFYLKLPLILVALFGVSKACRRLPNADSDHRNPH
jgi:hypothetical protein